MLQSSIKDYLHESQLFLGRVVVSGTLVILVLVALVGRLFYLQVENHDHFTTLSQDNRVKLEPLPPTRGLIYDRHGIILAQNLPAYSLEIIPEKSADLDDTIQQLSEIITISEDNISRFHRLRKQRRRFDSIPIRVRLKDEEVARIAVNLHRFPGVDVKAALLRNYPQHMKTTHLLGYVGRIDEQELQFIDTSNYSGTSFIGKNGVEKSYESLLHGKAGLQQVEVNAKGRVLRVLESQPPRPGENLRLFLDMELQSTALEALGEYNGAVAAIDTQSGGILTLVSKPGYDPNLFVEGISTKAYAALENSLDNPLFNRAIRGQYPPGSTVKPFIGLAALEYDVVGYHQETFCPGYYQLPGKEHKYRDWKKWGHGKVDLERAIVESCDVYYYELARTLGIDRLHEFLSGFGFGQPTQLDLDGELSGLMPSRHWKQQKRREPWYPGETLIVGIGQGYFLATPLQLASATATLANRGHRIRPRVVATIEQTDGTLRESPMIVDDLQPINPDHWTQIIDAMSLVIEGTHGTARSIRSNEYRIAGKTGTAQVFSVKQDEEYDEELISKRKRDHALFIAFAPVENPRIAIAVIVENGGHGGSIAAPIASKVMDRYLSGASRTVVSDAG
ncbi:MAG: penicillin-binding protein 2 [Candidatus Thiodiazotropha sp. (ex Lucinoma aequizonata)]|nr:penicillin-binding protein 2 [Candidatus Thiodiazotropha sp. (ex Lucinoma aequizonata)]MCU7887134.1 penicillin-binding protein 2 [Candidatus Thiodiazotropha sp. (ex Lucinoma aequizonata)]MCU7896149.1 penicillin-binding protein 2 [Candidatus Thiodiazotropha sp. (ex Lucinoma aequizonata)]MCU7898253.1 penicillin-binding protein 2 [Candidatus Thiodiazotropha sp. (ex Lucinoma aequizonata)]MCU7901820.1 penicillin-binding protein 2 [Candidatus Thiodiazotropha sp. (ex Lucinoma aequizonata)]